MPKSMYHSVYELAHCIDRRCVFWATEKAAELGLHASSHFHILNILASWRIYPQRSGWLGKDPRRAWAGGLVPYSVSVGKPPSLSPSVNEEAYILDILLGYMLFLGLPIPSGIYPHCPSTPNPSEFIMADALLLLRGWETVLNLCRWCWTHMWAARMCK